MDGADWSDWMDRTNRTYGVDWPYGSHGRCLDGYWSDWPYRLDGADWSDWMDRTYRPHRAYRVDRTYRPNGANRVDRADWADWANRRNWRNRTECDCHRHDDRHGRYVGPGDLRQCGRCGRVSDQRRE